MLCMGGAKPDLTEPKVVIFHVMKKEIEDIPIRIAMKAEQVMFRRGKGGRNR